MRYGKLENFSKKHPEISPLIQLLAEYIEFQSNRGVREIIPRVAAAKMNITEADTLGLLTLFEDASVIKHRYDLVCLRNSTVIESFGSLDEIPDQIECRYCDCEHDGESVRVELVFEILRTRSADAAA